MISTFVKSRHEIQVDGPLEEPVNVSILAYSQNKLPGKASLAADLYDPSASMVGAFQKNVYAELIMCVRMAAWSWVY